MASYTAPTTRASGYLVTAANWNTDIVENIKYLKDAPTFDGAVTASSTLTVGGTTDSSSSTTGAAKFAGGVGIAKKLYVGTDLAAGGVLTVSGNSATYGLEFNGSNGGGIACTHASGALRLYSGGTTKVAEFRSVPDFLIYYQTAISLGGSTGAQTNLYFGNGNGNVGSVSTNGTATAFNTSSDQRLKRDLGVASQTDVLRQTVVRDFEWLSDGVRARGVFAQEAYTVAPFAVSVGADESDEQGHLKNPWSVDYSKYVPDLIVGWQQHDAAIDKLAARIAALEAQESK